MLRNQLQVEMDWTYGDHISLSGIYRLAYEGSFDMQSVDQRARSTDFLDDRLRELYLTLAFDEWTIKIGKQQLVWGETDALRMADVINPLDISWHWSLESWEDIRRPLRMIVINYEPERFIQNNLSLETVFIPEDFKPTYYAHPGANWHFTMDDWELYRVAFRASEPSSSNDEYGFRIRWVMGEAEVSIFDFYGRSDSAIVNLDKFVGFALGTHGIDICDYPKFNSIGLTLNYEEPIHTKTVYRFEGSYNFDEPMNDLSFMIRKRDTINFMLGFDRSTWIRFLNPVHTFYISCQYFHKSILDWSDTEGVVSGSQSNDQHQDIISFFISGDYNNSIYVPQFMAVYDLSGTWYVQPQFKWNYSGALAFTIGANFFTSCTNRDSYWGAIRDNDEIYIKIRYGF
jgi:hypothetical protein